MSHFPGVLAEQRSTGPHFSIGIPPARSALADFPGTTLLIEVPAIRPLSRPARRPSEAASARFRARETRFATARRPKRRLRREIRMAGCVFAAVLPLAAALALLLGSPVSAAGRSRFVTAVSPPSVWLSIEGLGTVVPAEAETSVVLPGYLLPDDGVEESSHAGG